MKLITICPNCRTKNDKRNFINDTNIRTDECYECIGELYNKVPLAGSFDSLITETTCIACHTHYFSLVKINVSCVECISELKVDNILSLNSEEPYSTMLYEDNNPKQKIEVIDKYRDLYPRALREVLRSFKGTVVAFKVKPGESHQEGEMYWCGYWEKRYRVINKDGYHVTVEWVDGKITTHSTALDSRHDFRLELLSNKDFNHITNICSEFSNGKTTDSIRGAEIKMAILNSYFNEEVSEDIHYALYNLKYELNDSVYYYIERKSGFIRFYRDEDKSPRKNK